MFPLYKLLLYSPRHNGLSPTDPSQASSLTGSDTLKQAFKGRGRISAIPNLQVIVLTKKQLLKFIQM
jgi:hypothetical protein